jgi:hypothetical protein
MPNQYNMDPPETPEPPMCCGEYMEYDEDRNVLYCEDCKKEIEVVDPYKDFDPCVWLENPYETKLNSVSEKPQYAIGDKCPDPECTEHLPLQYDNGEPESRNHPGQSPALFCSSCGFETRNFDESRMNWENL